MPFRRVLIARGRDEIWYGEEKLAADRELLAGVGLEPQVFEFDGGHEWTDAFRERASRFLAGLAPERVPAPRS